MADDRPTSSDPPPSHFRHRPALHALLGGGAVADVLLLRRPNAAVGTAVTATAVWFVFERAGYSFLSVMANAVLLLVVILFFWAKSAQLLNRPLPPLPNLELTDAEVEKAADVARVWINKLLSFASDIAVKRDRKLFLQVILSLWVVSYIGGFFNFITLLYIGVLVSLVAPTMYERYQDHLDAKFGAARKVFLKQFTEKRPGPSFKEKKSE